MIQMEAVNNVLASLMGPARNMRYLSTVMYENVARVASPHPSYYSGSTIFFLRMNLVSILPCQAVASPEIIDVSDDLAEVNAVTEIPFEQRDFDIQICALRDME